MPRQGAGRFLPLILSLFIAAARGKGQGLVIGKAAPIDRCPVIAYKLYRLLRNSSLSSLTHDHRRAFMAERTTRVDESRSW